MIILLSSLQNLLVLLQATSEIGPASSFSFPRNVAIRHHHNDHPISLRHSPLLMETPSNASGVTNSGDGEAKQTLQNNAASTAIEDAFSRFDQDKSGGLGPWELTEALNYLDYDVSFPTTITLLNEYDSDNNKQLDIAEFTNLVTKTIPKDVCATFNIFADAKGFLVPSALKRALSSLGVDKDSKSSRVILDSFDANGDGRLGLLGFAQLVYKLPVAKFWLKIDGSGRIRNVRMQILKKLVLAPKKTVSVHSMLATISFGMCLLSLALIWSPGVNQFGMFQFTDLFKSYSDGEETIVRLTSILAPIVAMTGLFRIPPNSPACRRLMFEYSACSVVASTIMLNSNLSDFSRFTFDAWTLFGKLAILTPIIGSFVSAYRVMDDSITGTMKGRNTLPIMKTRRSAFLVSILLVFSSYVQLVQLSAPMLTTKAIASTWQRGMNVSTVLSTGLITSLLVSVVPTLRFENKLDDMGCRVVLLFGLVITGNVDLFRSQFALKKMFAVFPEFLLTLKSTRELLSNAHVNHLLVGGIVVTVLNALRRKFKKEGEETSKTMG